MDRINGRSIALGFVGSLLVFGVLYWLAGVDPSATIDAVHAADPLVLGLVFLCGVVWLTSWGLALRTVLGELGASISVAQSTAIFSGVLFANNVTPFGQAGGEPISGLLIARITDQRYERGLAAIASVDALNFIPSIGLALCGVLILGIDAPNTAQLPVVAGTFLALAVLVPLCGVISWQYRQYLQRGVVITLRPIVALLSRIRNQTITTGAIERRIGGFFSAIERIGTQPKTLLIALLLSSLGWIAQVGALWLSLLALGHTVSPMVVLIAIPIGAIAGVTPLPGGLGAIDLVLVGVLLALVSIARPTILAAVLIHRFVIYVIPTVVGGGVAAVIASENLRNTT